MTDTADSAAGNVREWLDESGLEWEQTSPHAFVVVLPGERKQRTTTSISIGTHYVTIQAFVARHPDENAAGLHRWLLERNRRMYAVAYCIDPLGDIYLSGRLPLSSITPDELDRILGSVLDNADGSFNTILELGFSSAISREWAWRLSRGEPTGNLQAFRHLADPEALGRSEAGSEPGT
ncbi:MAG: YbjN domain-containing protein [Actinomycetes bacterium]